jgi:hypothetical protein
MSPRDYRDSLFWLIVVSISLEEDYMGIYSFLGALPAILGIVGFFAYLWAGQTRVGGELFKQIVSKLRAAPNLEVGEYSKLTPSKIGKLLESDERVRGAVNDQDQKLIRLLIILQHGLTVVVLLVCAALIALGVWLMTRPQPLAIVANPPEATVADAKGILVDLDPIQVEWTSTGRAEPVDVFLEDVDNGKRTPKKSVASDVRSVVFAPADLTKIASNRAYRNSNRIRTVIEWSSGRSESAAKPLAVGIEVELALFGKLLTPDGHDRTIHTLLATIDESTETFPPNYCFNVDFVGWAKDNSALAIPLKSCDSDSEVKIPGLNSVNWSRRFGLVYNGPDDPRIVRTRVSGAPDPNSPGK